MFNPGEHLCDSRPRGYKTFFMLNSVEHEILNAHNYKKYQEIRLFEAQISLECHFLMLMNVEMPTINANNCWHFNIYEQDKFHAQSS